MRFAHGAAMQQQQQAHEAGGMRSVGVTRIREVWASNLHAELETIRSLVDKYPFISMVRILSIECRSESKIKLIIPRTLNSQEWSLALLAISQQRQIIITSAYAVTLIC